MTDDYAYWQPLVAQATVPAHLVGDVVVPVLPDAPAIPTPGPVITYVGKGLQAAWSDVWSWTKEQAKSDLQIAHAVESAVTDVVQPWIESYVGSLLKSLSGFINQAVQYTGDTATALSQATQSFATWAIDELDGLGNDVYAALGAIATIEGVVVPWLEGVIAAVGAEAVTIAHQVGIDVEQWTVDHVLNPVLVDLYDLAAEVGVYVDDVVRAATADVVYLIEQVNAETLAKLGVIAATAAATATWVEECGVPMCDNMGPATDLFKLLKALAIAGDLALLAEFLSLDKAGVEDRLHDAISVMGTIITDFDQFVTGGETVGGFLGRVASLA